MFGQRVPFLMATAMMVGCGVTSRPVCEVVSETEVLDDEVTDFGTADELLGRIARDARLPAVWWDGVATEADVRIARGRGPAMLVEQVQGSEKSRHLGFGQSYLMIAVDCPDQLRVPVEARVASADGALEVSASGDAETPMAFGETGARLALDGDFAEATFPVSEDDPADYHDLYAFVTLTYDEAGTLTDGTAGWGGSKETADARVSHAEHVIGFSDGPAPEP